MPERAETLPRSRILRRRSALRNLRETGRRRSHSSMTLFVGLRPAESDARAAFVTPKALGSAVVRNRLRRRMREIYRRHLAALLEDRQVIWSARSAAAGMDFQDLKQVMVALGTKSV